MKLQRKVRPFSLDTGGLHLRSMRASDACQSMVDGLNHPKVARAINFVDGEFTIEKLRAFIEGFDNAQRYLVGIFPKGRTTPVGFYRVELGPRHKTAHMMVAVTDIDWLGRGLFHATCEAVCNEFFERRDVEKVTSHVNTRNYMMLAHMTTTRFKLEGKLRKEVIGPDGERLDQYIFAWIKGE